jgi:hypothetical protein
MVKHILQGHTYGRMAGENP